MTKRDFELIASVLRNNAWDAFLPERFAAVLAGTNPRFNRSRFLAACRGEDSTDSAGRKVRYSTDPLVGSR